MQNKVPARLLSFTCACLARARPWRSLLCASSGEHTPQNHAAEEGLMRWGTGAGVNKSARQLMALAVTAAHSASILSVSHTTPT